jgi:multidrug efflux system membrane fusion protein
VWLLIFGGLGYGAFRYFQDTQAKQKQDEQKQARRMANRPVPVVAAPAHRGDVPVLLRGLGTVTAFNTVTVKSRVDGPLVQVLYREGQFVKKGDVLAEIDPRPFQVALEQAQGQMARDQAQLKDAQVNLARYQALWQEQVIAKQQLDTQAATVGQFKGTLEADQAAINNAQLQLSFTKITSPLSGRIGLRLVDVGNIVHTADQNGIAVITQLEPISVIFTIPADNLPPVLRKLRAGAALPVEAYDRDDKNRIATGTLLTVDNQIDTTTGTSRLKAVFDNRDGALFPNQFVNCRLRLDTLRGVVIVPSVALETGPKGSFVFGVTPDGKAAMRQVATGPTEGDNTVITSGLNAGEMVVIDGQDKLQDGARVDARGANGGAGRSGGRRTGGQGEIGRGTKGAVRPNTPPTPAQEGVQGQGPRR